jgi:glutamate-1-semialdehyde 2,1-aminomutase
MSRLSPEGPVYKAGTISGNPVAMAAGLASLRKLKAAPAVYEELERRARKLMAGFEGAAREAGLPLVTEVRGSMFGFFFTDEAVRNFEEAKRGDNALFKGFHREMLDRGVYLACSSYETGFISTAIGDDLIDRTILAAHEAMRAIRENR